LALYRWYPIGSSQTSITPFMMPVSLSDIIYIHVLTPVTYLYKQSKNHPQLELLLSSTIAKAIGNNLLFA